MDLELIKSEYAAGESLSSLSEKYALPLGKLRGIAYRERWRELKGDGLSSLRLAADVTARLLLKLGKKNEETVASGGKVDARDVKYLTSAQKELLEVLRVIYFADEPKEEKGDLSLGEETAGIIVLSDVIKSEK